VKLSKRELPLGLGESSGSELEHAKNAGIIAIKLTRMERLNAAKRGIIDFWVMVLPRNIVAKHLMMLRPQAGFPASTK
jgi:hypothetical protein